MANLFQILAYFCKVCYTYGMKLSSSVQGKRICVALSGGADSVALLHKLLCARDTYAFTLTAAHCEHGIRGADSLADMAFVQALCAQWEIPLFLFSEDCVAAAKEKSVSLETAGREFRYRAFQSLLDEDKTDFVALAHHADDEAETVLFRLARGSSLTGAGAMREENGKFLRPMLDESKAEILAYVENHGLAYCDDKTNRERIATRNILRLDVLPALENAVAGAKTNLARFASLAREDDELLARLATPLCAEVEPLDDGDTGVRVRFSPERALLRRACLAAMKKVGIVCDYTYAVIDGTASLFDKQTGAKISLPNGFYAVRAYDEIAFHREREQGVQPTEIAYREGRFAWGRYEITVSETPTGTIGELQFDGSQIPQGAVFRGRETGDTFRKFGGGEKPLKKFLIDKKIPSALRDMPVLAIGKEILCVCGVEIAERMKVTNETKKIRYVSVKRG